MTSKKGGNGGEDRKKLEVHYLKMPCYRTYHVDGAFGGIAPNGNLYMELFVERLPTPQVIKHKITPEGLGEEVERQGKQGIIREVEAGVVMNMEVAKVLRSWLDGKINEFESRMKQKGRVM